MRIFISSLFFAVILVACASNEDPRYRNTEMLERPPTLPANTVNKLAGEIIQADEAVIPKKRQHKGLGDDVYLASSTPMQINIKQSFENAWPMLELALKQNDIKIIDQERDKKRFYVAYRPSSIAGLFGSMLDVEQKGALYELRLTETGHETEVKALPANMPEQGDFNESSDDDADDLLYKLFETLRDDLEN